MSASTPKANRNNSNNECGSPDDCSDGTESLLVEHPDKAIVTPKDTRSGLDRLLQGYTKFMGPGLHQDRGLKLLQWTLWMFSYALHDRTILRDALKKLFNEISFSRYVLRLLQMPLALEAARSGSWAVGSDSNGNLHKCLGQLLAWSMIGYYPLEHAAYIQWQAPTLFFPKTGGPSRLAEKLSAWSCRFWVAYMLSEILQCWFKLREETQKLKLIQDAKKTDQEASNEDAMIVPPQPGLLRTLRLQIVRDLLFLLPGIQWSLPNWDREPWLPVPVVNTLMWFESVVCMYQTVANFKES